jgi:hypothetical protein
MKRHRYPAPPDGVIDMLFGRDPQPKPAPLDDAGVYTARRCDACGCSCNGIEPLYPMNVAVEIIPFPSRAALDEWLRSHAAEFPPARIRKYGWTKKRMLTQSEIFRIREILMKPYSRGSGRPPGHPLMRMMRDAGAAQPRDAAQEER